MSSTMRRRLYHGDLDGTRHEHFDTSAVDGVGEALIQDDVRPHNILVSRAPTLKDIWDDERKKEQLHWSLLFTQLVFQWTQWFGTGSLLGRLLPISSVIQQGPNRRFLQCSLSPLQDVRLKHLRRRLGVPFDGSRTKHREALKQLWRLAYPNREVPPHKSMLWKEMGWQGCDPSTDFRGGSFISLENLIFFAKKFPNSFKRLLHKRDGQRAEWEYPFAVAGINISFMLVQMLGVLRGKPSTPTGDRFLQLLEIDEMAFDNLYCVAFQMMDAQWLAVNASYMQFNDVLNSTRMQLECELALEDVHSISDLPAYNLLRE